MKPKYRAKRVLVTSNDVARHANVSQATVSRVFSNTAQVKPETVDQVLKAADELGYRPNAIARSLTSSKTDMIAVVSVNFDNPFYQTLLIKMSHMITSMGKKMMFIQSPFEQALDDILYQVMEYQVDGIIVLSAALSSKMAYEFARVRTPLVVFNKHFDGRNYFSVCSDNIDAGHLVAEHLVQKGYKSFGFISGDLLKQTSEFRFRGYTEYLDKHGFTDCTVAAGDYSYRSGYEALLSMRQKGALPEAVFCVNDLMALGAMDAARQELGLSIPKDIAFVGFDDLEQCRWRAYQLTSVQQPIDEMIEYTKNYLSKKFENADTSGGYMLLKCKLNPRASS